MAKKRSGNGSVADRTIEILKQIRDEVRTTNQRLDVTNQGLDSVNQRLDSVNQRLDVHEKALVKLIGEVHSLNDGFDNFLTGAHGKDHDDLRGRVERLEKKLAG